MAAGSTTYTFQVSLADITRSIYEPITIRVARHASELCESTVCKVLAYSLEYDPSLELSKGLDDPEMPALWTRDLTGTLTQWIEIGAPSSEKLHKASKRVGNVRIYTYKNPEIFIQSIAGETIHRSEQIKLISFTDGFISKIAETLEKRNYWAMTVTEGSVYIEITGDSFTSSIIQQTL